MGSPSICSRTGSPARPTSSDQRVEAIEARLGRELDAVALVAHRPEEAPHLRKRRAAGLFDALQRIPILVERLGQLVADGADLEHHHADRVGDDVVELARDAGTLLGHRDAGGRLAFALGLERTLFRRFGLLGPLAQREAGQPADPEQDGSEDELGRRVPGVVVDDECGTAERDHQADSRLSAVAEISEQERRGQSGDGGAGGERDQPSVDERERAGD